MPRSSPSFPGANPAQPLSERAIRPPGPGDVPSPLELRRWCARHANVALTDVDLREADEPLRLLCECGERSCTEWLTVSLEAFDEIRAQAGRYLVAHDHVRDLLPVHWTDDYEVVTER